MSTLEEYMQRATAPGSDRKIPGAVLIVANKDGAWELAAEYFYRQTRIMQYPLLQSIQAGC